MPAFILIFFTIFTMVVLYSIFNFIKTRKQNNEPIKKFFVEGKLYLLYAKQTYNKHYNNRVIYELRDSNNQVIGTFNTLNDVLVLLNIDKFSVEDEYN